MLQSLPSRERGLKLQLLQSVEEQEQVAPLAGAWIEILMTDGTIETESVAPIAGAWIEMCASAPLPISAYRRSPRGSVD